MTLADFTLHLFCRIDDVLTDQEKHSRAHLWPSELVTIGVLFALKGRPARAFDRWLRANLLMLFPRLPERTRLFRLLARYQHLTTRFLAATTARGFCDSFGVELVHPKREGRSRQQIGRKGLSNHRWIVGVKFCPLVNQAGYIVDWDAEAANVHDSTFQRMIGDYATGNETMTVLVDGNFHRAFKRGGDCANLVVCRRGEHNERMGIETLFSQLTNCFALKKVTQRAWPYVEARLAFVAAAYNLLAAWHGADGRPCVAEFVI